MNSVTKEQAEDQIKSGAKKVTVDDIRYILEKRSVIEEKFRTNGPLQRFIGDLRLLFSITHDYIKREYREVPFWTISAIGAALLYVLSPIDLIPDFIPGLGLIDDAAVVAVCLRMIEEDLHHYRGWKMRQVERIG